MKGSSQLLFEAVRECDLMKLLNVYGSGQKLNIVVPADNPVRTDNSLELFIPKCFASFKSQPSEPCLHTLVRYNGPFMDCLPLMAMILQNE